MFEQQPDGAAFAARNDQSIQSGQIGWSADFSRLDANFAKRPPVLAKVALESEDSDAHGTTSHA